MEMFFFYLASSVFYSQELFFLRWENITYEAVNFGMSHFCEVNYIFLNNQQNADLSFIWLFKWLSDIHASVSFLFGYLKGI